MTTPAVIIQNMIVVLGGKFAVLKTINVSLPGGRITGLIGPSGAGKTTLIRSIVGRQKLTSGSISVFGLPAGSPRLRAQLSYMPQETSVYIDLSASDNLIYLPRCLVSKERTCLQSSPTYYKP